jgi:catechol 2,3-dioxygenase-like lactoylglutathione lyase family enzyme
MPYADETRAEYWKHDASMMCPQDGDREVELLFREPQVNFFVQDVETSVRFYTDLFGFDETFRAPASGPTEFVEVRLGGLTLGLGSIEAARRVHGLDVVPGPPRAEVCLWTNDVDRAHSELVSRGVQSLRGPHDFGGRLRSAWVLDPDGNPVEIVAERDEPSAS